MLEILLFSLVTSASAFTTHRYDIYDNFGNYRPSTGMLDNSFGYDSSNGRRPVQVYEYGKRYDGLVISEVYTRPNVGENRRIDTPYSYENQWNRPVPLNRVAVTEPAKFFSRFEGTNQDRKYVYSIDTRNRQPVVVQAKEVVLDQRKQTNGLHKTQEVPSPQVSVQSDDVNRTQAITEQKSTWHNDHQGSSNNNTNVSTRSINTDSKTNALNVSEKTKADRINHPSKTNEGTASNRNGNQNKTANNSKDYGTKTAEDNEVTPRTEESRTKAYEEDRWIWSNGEDQEVDTTTLLFVDDRAAFSGDGCPMGMVKLGTTCVPKD